MTLSVSRRAFLAGAAASAFAHGSTPASHAAEDGGLLLVVHGGDGTWGDLAAALGPSDPSHPTLIVGERLRVDAERLSSSVLVSWAALDLLPPDRLSKLLRERAPARVAAASGVYPVPRRATWARLGRLMAVPPPFACVVADLGTGGSPASPTAVADGVDALRDGLGQPAASRLTVRYAGRSIRYG